MIVSEAFFKPIKKDGNFEDNFSPKIEVDHPQISSPKYGQTSNVKPLTANRSLSFAVKWLNLNLKVTSSYLPLLRHPPRSRPYHLSHKRTPLSTVTTDPTNCMAQRCTKLMRIVSTIKWNHKIFIPFFRRGGIPKRAERVPWTTPQNFERSGRKSRTRNSVQ